MTFGTDEPGPVDMKIGLSYVSVENAAANLQAEAPDWGFDALLARTQAKWLERLSRVEIEAPADIRSVFYTADHNLSAEHPYGKPVGLQLYTVRDELEKDVPGTIKKVAAIGYKEVETYALYGMPASQFAKLLEGQWPHRAQRPLHAERYQGPIGKSRLLKPGNWASSTW